MSSPFLRALSRHARASVPASPSIPSPLLAALLGFLPTASIPNSASIPAAMASGALFSGGAAHSASTSGGGGGSPSGHAASDRGAASASVSTPASESTVARRLNGLDLQGDDAPSSQPAVRFVSQMLRLIPLLLDNLCSVPSSRLLALLGEAMCCAAS